MASPLDRKLPSPTGDAYYEELAARSRQWVSAPEKPPRLGLEPLVVQFLREVQPWIARTRPRTTRSVHLEHRGLFSRGPHCEGLVKTMAQFVANRCHIPNALTFPPSSIPARIRRLPPT